MRLIVLLLLSLLAASDRAAIEGLWSYRTIAPSGGRAVPIDGLFLFREGRFIQQSVSAGEPFERQVAQAHAGTYRRDGDRVRLHAEVGLVVDPSRAAPVEWRHATDHVVDARTAPGVLVLTFGTGTVQTFAAAESSVGELVVLDRGALALIGRHFLLVAERDGEAVAGSGSFDRHADALRLRADRWIAVRGGTPVYRRGVVFDARLTGDALEIEDDWKFKIPD